jgi:hypothetical protein
MLAGIRGEEKLLIRGPGSEERRRDQDPTLPFKETPLMT